MPLKLDCPELELRHTHWSGFDGPTKFSFAHDLAGKTVVDLLEINSDKVQGLLDRPGVFWKKGMESRELIDHFSWQVCLCV